LSHSLPQAPPAAVPANVTTREHGLDALRVFAFAILILYHSGMGFVSWGWHVKNPETSPALEHVMIFFNRWRLPLLFFISGAGVAFSLRRRSFSQFAGERTARLLLPLVFGMFVIVPPQIYFERLTQQASFGSYWGFYPTVFELVSYPAGSLSWHHLWFVAYVFVFALISVPLFALARSGRGVRALGVFAAWMERHSPAIYLVNVPNLAAGVVLGPHWPTTHNLTSDWANFTGSWMTFLWGFVFASERRLLDIVTRRRREFLVLGIAVALLFFYLRATGITRGLPPTIRHVLSNLVSGYFGLAWIFALIGYSRAWITRGTPALRYATEAVYPFYIVHQTITVALVFWLIPWNASIPAKLSIVAGGTFAGSWAVFEAVRRIRPLRPLFGLRLAPIKSD
jgi:hypothetical protein